MANTKESGQQPGSFGFSSRAFQCGGHSIVYTSNSHSDPVKFCEDLWFSLTGEADQWRSVESVSSEISLSAFISSSFSGSVTGVEITYPPLAHLPRSIRRQRSLQKGKFSSLANTSVRHVGQ